MIELLRHIAGLCGEGHISLIHIIGSLGAISAFVWGWFKLKLNELFEAGGD